MAASSGGPRLALALALADQTTLRLPEPPMPLQPIHLLMLWTSSADADFGHSWLRRAILSLIAELDGDLSKEAPGASAGQAKTATSAHHG